MVHSSSPGFYEIKHDVKTVKMTSAETLAKVAKEILGKTNFDENASSALSSSSSSSSKSSSFPSKVEIESKTVANPACVASVGAESMTPPASKSCSSTSSNSAKLQTSDLNSPGSSFHHDNPMVSPESTLTPCFSSSSSSSSHRVLGSSSSSPNLISFSAFSSSSSTQRERPHCDSHMKPIISKPLFTMHALTPTLEVEKIPSSSPSVLPVDANADAARVCSLLLNKLANESINIATTPSDSVAVEALPSSSSSSCDSSVSSSFSSPPPSSLQRGSSAVNADIVEAALQLLCQVIIMQRTTDAFLC
jgi:hypothetical protein